MSSKDLGALGEKIAENFLKKKGYKILDRNYIPRFVSGPQRGEIDIIAKKDDAIIFVEVKAAVINSGSQPSRSFRGGLSSALLPEDKVNYSKQRKIIKAAESWLMAKKIPFDQKWQIDVISIVIDRETKKAKVRHLENAVF